VCNTVAEAQDTFLSLRTWFEGLDAPAPELMLLHARFPASRREQITREITGKFGKCERCPDLARCVHRPRAAVVVATQVIEQSLDLDFDLMVSDLAPVALLLQRAGRCWRHDGRKRPPWAYEPRLAVDTSGGLALPRSWPFVYSRSLLRRTDAELDDGVIAIPGDVQHLVEKVYDEAFADGEMDADDMEWFGKQMAEASLAEMAAIPEPDALSGLHSLTSSELSEDMAATRLGADSIRVLCAYRGSNAGLYLDAERSVKLPRTGKLSRSVVKTILAQTIPLRATLLKDRDTANDPPASWSGNAWLSDLVIIPLDVSIDGRAAGWIGQREFHLNPDLGLQITTSA
jgi:CRISPR-associated endonuclease/helicase Cas3